MTKPFAIGVALLISGLGQAIAGPGASDPTFGGNGFIPLPTGFRSCAIAVQPDRKPVIAVEFNVDAPRVALMRLNPDGSADASFHGAVDATRTDGILTGWRSAEKCAVSVLANGSLAFAALVSNGGIDPDQIVVIRFREDGSLVESFGIGGAAWTALSGRHEMTVTGLLFASDGALLVGGYAVAERRSIVVLRLTNSGAPDPQFGTDGVARIDRKTSTYGLGGGLAVQPDGRILLTDADVPSAFVVARFLSDGRVDASFAGGGVAAIPVASAAAYRAEATAVAVQPDGAIVVAGHVLTGGPNLSLRDDFALVRLLANGSPDPAFGGGRVVVDPRGAFVVASKLGDATRGYPTKLVLQADGRIVLAGTVFDGIGLRAGLARFGSDGALDATFGRGGNALGPSGLIARVGAAEPSIGGDTDTIVVAGQMARGSWIARHLLQATPGRIDLAVDRNPLPSGGALALTADVLPRSATGRVTLLAGGAPIPGCLGVALAAGPDAASASCTTEALTIGHHEVAAAYYGDASNSPNVSDALVVTVGPPAGTTAVEYFHRELGDYFVTSGSEEIALLDAGATIGWQRTGWSFPVFSGMFGHAWNMCRYYSGAAFAPRGSHFFAATDVECTQVRAPWIEEGGALRVGRPGESDDCPAGTQPLFRLYNGGKDGVPHHRLTTSTLVREKMLGEGWVAEGVGIGVVGCVPLAPP